MYGIEQIRQYHCLDVDEGGGEEMEWYGTVRYGMVLQIKLHSSHGIFSLSRVNVLPPAHFPFPCLRLHTLDFGKICGMYM